MSLYIDLLEKEVKRLRKKNRKLKHELAEASMTPADRAMRKLSADITRDLYTPGDLKGIQSIVNEMDKELLPSSDT